MAVEIVAEARDWSFEQDDEGHRNYDIAHLVHCTGDGERLEGLAEVSLTPGLPAIGSTWLIDGDRDDWAYCAPYMKVTPHDVKPGEKPTFYLVEQKFTTKAWKRCQDQTIENPLLEPQKVSGTFEKYTREADLDKHGQPLTTSSKELHTGPRVEVDGNRPTVRIQQNVADLDLPLITRMMGKVNDAPLWGLPERCIKVSSAAWERLIQGRCNYYYQRSFEFDIAYETFDRRLLDHSRVTLNSRYVHLDFGCTVSFNVTSSASGSRIDKSSLAIVSGGIGYPPDMDGSVTDPPGQKDLFLQIVGKYPARGGIIQVETDNAGTVIDIIGATGFTGYGYKDTTAAQTVMDKLTLAPMKVGKATSAELNNPTHYAKAKDIRGNSIKVLLDGKGKPATSGEIQFNPDGTPMDGVGSPYYKSHKIYQEDNLLLLGIPTSL